MGELINRNADNWRPRNCRRNRQGLAGKYSKARCLVR
jgi:hypothetical protein